MLNDRPMHPPVGADFSRIRGVLLRHVHVADAEVVGVLDDIRELRVTAIVERCGAVAPGQLNALLVHHLREPRLVPKEYIFTFAAGLNDLRRLAGRLGHGDVITDLDLSLWLGEQGERLH